MILRPRPLALSTASITASISVAALLLAGCATEDPAPADAGPGSRLAPTFEPSTPSASAGQQGRGKAGTKKGSKPDSPSSTASTAGSAPSSPAPDGPSGSDGPGAPSPASTPDAPPSAPSSAAPAGPRTARLTDPRGDAEGLNRPAFLDLTGARLTLEGGRYELVVETAGSLPARQSDSNTMNVAGFFDVDGDGAVDYEVWGNLSDSGWSPSYRHPSGAKFGSASGVAVHASGSSLVFGFAASHLGSASTFRWAVGAEYGTYEQVASGLTSSDHAPDGGGAVPFPG